MRSFSILAILALLISCDTPVEEKNMTSSPETNVSEELAAIEELRHSFEDAIRDQRFDDLKFLVARDGKSIGPGSEKWMEMYRTRGERGLFPYDSIDMKANETVLLNDTIAYDWGTSTVYTSDAEGNVIVLHDSFLVILKKEDGKWKLYREVASGNVMN